MTPAESGLPYSSWYPGQEQAVRLALAARQRFVLIVAPPGSGKSGIATALANLNPGRTHILVSTHDLQEQYRATFQTLLVKGRSAFPCIIQPPLMADRGRCTLGMHCEFAGLRGAPGCPYFDQLRAGVTAKTLVTNYSLYASSRGPELGRPSLLICDEAHLMEATLRPEVLIDHSLFTRLDLCPKNFWPQTLEDWQMVAGQNLARLEALQVSARYFESGDSEIDEQVRAEAARPVYQAITTLTAIRDMRGEVIIQPRERNTLLTQLDAGPVAKRFYPRDGRTIFLTSTPGTVDEFFKRLGVDPTEALVLDVPSSFAPERRPFYVWPVSKVQGGAANSTWTPLVPAISKLLERYPDKSGILHTTSYNLARHVVAQFPRGRLALLPSGQGRNQVLTTFRARPGSTVLVSPSLTTGIDLPYDLLRWQAILKIPFPDRSDPVVAALGNKRGIEQAAITLVQTYGRAMRVADDYGDTWLLDANWSWFKHAAAASLSAWFIAAIKYGGKPTV